jgi:lysozyme
MITKDKSIIKGHEGLELVAYKDGGGVWTIGYGHTGAEVKVGMLITLAQAEELLTRDLRSSEGHINTSVTVPLTQNQFDALVSFVFNVGGGAFESSTLLKLLNAGNYAGAADQLLRWNKDEGKIVQGLSNRREAERKLFLS